MAKSSGSGAHQQMSLDLLPSALLATVMTKLDIASIRSLACTCKAFHSCASHMLCFIPSFHLLVSLFLMFFYMAWHQFSFSKLVCSYQDIAPSAEFLRPLLPPNPYLRSLKVDCMRLDDSSLDYLLQPTLQELCLHNCADFSGRLLSQVGQYCKDLRLSLSKLFLFSLSKSMYGLFLVSLYCGMTWEKVREKRKKNRKLIWWFVQLVISLFVIFNFALQVSLFELFGGEERQINWCIWSRGLIWRMHSAGSKASWKCGIIKI